MSNMEHIKPGDRVRITDSFTNKMDTVERVTKTQVILRDGSKFRRSDGGKVGATRWDRVYIANLSDDDFLRITYHKAINEAGAILTTRDVSGTNNARLDAYGARLREAKTIIDAALNTEEEA